MLSTRETKFPFAGIYIAEHRTTVTMFYVLQLLHRSNFLAELYSIILAGNWEKNWFREERYLFDKYGTELWNINANDYGEMDIWRATDGVPPNGEAYISPESLPAKLKEATQEYLNVSAHFPVAIFFQSFMHIAILWGVLWNERIGY